VVAESPLSTVANIASSSLISCGSVTGDTEGCFRLARRSNGDRRHARRLDCGVTDTHFQRDDALATRVLVLIPMRMLFRSATAGVSVSNSKKDEAKSDTARLDGRTSFATSESLAASRKERATRHPFRGCELSHTDRRVSEPTRSTGDYAGIALKARRPDRRSCPVPNCAHRTIFDIGIVAGIHAFGGDAEVVVDDAGTDVEGSSRRGVSLWAPSRSWSGSGGWWASAGGRSGSGCGHDAAPRGRDAASSDRSAVIAETRS
jgi:hypothetical protein